MEHNQGNARVTRTTDNRSFRGILRLGQALIALAQAQAEAEAQAQVEAAARAKPRPGLAADAASIRQHDDPSRSPGDPA